MKIFVVFRSLFPAFIVLFVALLTGCASTSNTSGMKASTQLIYRYDETAGEYEEFGNPEMSAFYKERADEQRDAYEHDHHMGLFDLMFSVMFDALLR